MLLDCLLFLVGLGLLIWSADRFVYGAAAIANNYGIPPIIIGLTIVAMGSSAPEVMISATAALDGKINTAVGNALGSNITNIALVLGVTALLKPLAVASNTVNKELPVLVLCSAIAGWLIHDAYLGTSEGIGLLVVFASAMAYLVYSAYKQNKLSPTDPLAEEVDAEIPHDVATWKAVLWLLVGMVVLGFSSDLLVTSASKIASELGMSDLVIGLTVIAIGTSLPELAACIAGVMKKEDDLVLGNIIGSNLFNILFVMAVPAVLAPGAIDPNAAGRDFYVMMGLTVLLFAMAIAFGKSRQINRWEGGALLACFVGYQFLLFFG